MSPETPKAKQKQQKKQRKNKHTSPNHRWQPELGTQFLQATLIPQVPTNPPTQPPPRSKIPSPSTAPSSQLHYSKKLHELVDFETESSSKMLLIIWSTNINSLVSCRCKRFCQTWDSFLFFVFRNLGFLKRSRIQARVLNLFKDLGGLCVWSKLRIKLGSKHTHTHTHTHI
jgi:hypothetical protein